MQRLLHLLFNFFLFAGTLFAVGDAGFGGTGADGGGGEGDSGAAGEGASEGGEQGASGEDDTASGEAAAGDTGEEEGQEAAGEEDPDAPVDLGDGRTIPAKWKKLIEAAKAQGLDKEVKQLFFGSQRLLQKFPGGVNEAIRLAESIEERGGLEAIDELQEQISVYESDANLFLKDQRKWVETSFSEDEDASLKAFSHAIDFVGENYPEQYNHLMGKVVLNTLAESPIHSAYNLLAAMKDNPAAQREANRLADFYNGIHGLASKVPEKKVDAQQTKLAAEREKLNSEQSDLRNQTANSQIFPILGRDMTDAVERLAKNNGVDLKKLSAEQPGVVRAMRTEILKRLVAKAAADKAYARNYKSHLQAGEVRKAVNLADKKHKAILPEIVNEVAKEYGLLKKGAAASRSTQRPNGRTAAGGSGELKVSAKPQNSEIDYQRTPTSMLLDSKAVLKNGKTVTWA